MASGSLEIPDTKKKECIEVLLQYVLTDTLLYLPDVSDIKKTYEGKVSQALGYINSFLETNYEIAYGLSVKDSTFAQSAKLKVYLESISHRNFEVLYFVSTTLRSVLLGVLFTEKLITVNDAFELAFFEELYQQKKWGTDDEIIKRHQDIKEILEKLEKKRDERSLS